MATRQKILILDDEQDILEIYQEILARLPSLPDIQTVNNGAQAIAMLESQPFNLLLLDLRMPQMDGFQALAIVRRKFPALRVVVMKSRAVRKRRIGSPGRRAPVVHRRRTRHISRHDCERRTPA